MKPLRNLSFCWREPCKATDGFLPPPLVRRMFPTPTLLFIFIFIYIYIFFILRPNKTHTTEPHHTKLFFWGTSKSQNISSIYIFHTPPPQRKNKKKRTQQLPLRCPQETKLYDTERLVVAFGVTSLLLGLEGGNASMMEECQVTWRRRPSLKLTAVYAPERWGPPGSFRRFRPPNQNPWFLGGFLLKL